MSLSVEEKKIIEKIINKDEGVTLKLYNKFNKQVYNFVYKQLNNVQLSEEITQDIFLDFIESLRDFRGESSLKTFLFSIARHKVIDIIRRKKFKRVFFSHLSSSLIESLSTFILDDEIEKKDVKDKVKTTFDRLPHDYRIILRLKYINGERVKEIAEKLSLTFKAAESLLFRARKAFTKVFKSLP